MNLEIKKIITADRDIVKTITDWMYDWWGNKEGYSYEATECYIKHSFQTDKLPQTYGLFLNEDLIGMYQFTNRDLFCRPDIYPWLANVYIDEKFRNMGYGKFLIKSIKENAINNLPNDEIYLFTDKIGLYEKFGWEFVCNIDSFDENSQNEKIYKLHLT